MGMYQTSFYFLAGRRLINNRYKLFQIDLGIGINYFTQRNQGFITGSASGKKLPKELSEFADPKDKDIDEVITKHYTVDNININGEVDNISPASGLSLGLKISPTYQRLLNNVGLEVGMDIFMSVGSVFMSKEPNNTLLVGEMASSRTTSVLEDHLKPGSLLGISLRAGILFRSKNK